VQKRSKSASYLQLRVERIIAESGKRRKEWGVEEKRLIDLCVWRIKGRDKGGRLEHVLSARRGKEGKQEGEQGVIGRWVGGLVFFLVWGV